METPQHPSQLPPDWETQIGHNDDAYAQFQQLEQTRQRIIKKLLRNPNTGQWMRRRNTPESMANAPSPYKDRVFYPAPLHNLVRPDGKGFPADVYDKLQEYFDNRPAAARWNRETFEAINKARGMPEQAITVFRPVPRIIDQFLPGDSVLLSPSYANSLAASRPRWRVITGTVPANQLYTRSNDQLMRWDWRGRDPLPNGGVVTSAPQPIARRWTLSGSRANEPQQP